MSDNETLLLAHTIAEWSYAEEHLTALQPHAAVPYTVLGRIRTELNGLAMRWSAVVSGDTFFPGVNAVIAQCREYVTANLNDLDELLNREREE